MKRVLVLYYSQSGQLLEILNQLTLPLQSNPELSITFCEIEPDPPFSFPWNNHTFFEAFPESVMQIPQGVKPLPEHVMQNKYDLIILGYQVWFLSISIPINSFLFSSDAAQLFQNTPVLTVIGCRNMWVNAQEKMKKRLQELQAHLVGNIVLTDKAPNLISAYTIVKWMFTGKKEKYLGIFPKPGISDQDINNASVFAAPIRQAIQQNNYATLHNQLLSLGAVSIKPFIVTIEKRGALIFNKWAQIIIRKKSSRRRWLRVFNIYLAVAIWGISPVAYLLYLITYPFTSNNRKKLTNYYQGIQLK
jgi:hypothetical protein